MQSCSVAAAEKRKRGSTEFSISAGGVASAIYHQRSIGREGSREPNPVAGCRLGVRHTIPTMAPCPANSRALGLSGGPLCRVNGPRVRVNIWSQEEAVERFV